MNSENAFLIAGIGADFADFFDLEGDVQFLIRLLFAMVLGGVLGWQRESIGKHAGLRTFMMVCVASALMTSVAITAQFSTADTSRVVQGLLTGVGFLGAGAILKREEQQEVQGLTTAAGIWLTATVGIAVGLGRLGLATIGTGLAFLIFDQLGRWEQRMKTREDEIRTKNED